MLTAPTVLPFPAMPWIEVSDYSGQQGWAAGTDRNVRARWYCEQLEQGKILFFKQPPFRLPADDREFLVGQKHSGSRLHKNISYRPGQDMLRGFSDDEANRDRVQTIMRQYSAEVTRFVSQFLSPYANNLIMDFASFRPLEEEGRDLPLHKRNDLLHVDSFPSRPTRGGRILRVFTNVNPSKNRVWMTGENFPSLAQKYANDAGLAAFAASGGGSLRGRLVHLLSKSGLPLVERPPYDRFMLHFHDYLKENESYQKGGDKERVEFPPMATWLVFTDGVPHAALSGQYAMEQTYMIPPHALVAPDAAPIRVLERLCGKTLSN